MPARVVGHDVFGFGRLDVGKRPVEIGMVGERDTERALGILHHRIIAAGHIGAEGDGAALGDLHGKLIAGPVEADELAEPKVCPPLVRGDQEKSDLWSYLEKPHQDKRGFW